MATVNLIILFKAAHLHIIAMSAEQKTEGLRDNLLIRSPVLSCNKSPLHSSPMSPNSETTLRGRSVSEKGKLASGKKMEGRLAVLGYLKLILLSFDYNIEEYLEDIDQARYQEIKQILHIAPGYKPIRLVYGFYAYKYGMLMGTFLALLYPLPYSLLFLYTFFDTLVPFFAIFGLAGLRSGAIGINIKYFLHWPSYKFQWIVLLFTAFISNIFENYYIYMLLYMITIFLSLFVKDELRNSDHQSSLEGDQRLNSRISDHLYNQNVNFTEMECYRHSMIQPNLPQTHPTRSLWLLLVGFSTAFIFNKFGQGKEFRIFFSLFPLSLLPYSKQIIAFFPYLFGKVVARTSLSPANLIACSYLLPGPQIKVFMFLVDHNQPLNAVVAYLCLYLPSILMCNIFIGHYDMFCSLTYFNIRLTIQAVSNGLVFTFVIWMLAEEDCMFNMVLCTSVVIFAVAKLYRTRELAAMTLATFLISMRSMILHINKGIPFQEQACLQNNTQAVS